MKPLPGTRRLLRHLLQASTSRRCSRRNGAHSSKLARTTYVPSRLMLRIRADQIGVYIVGNTYRTMPSRCFENTESIVATSMPPSYHRPEIPLSKSLVHSVERLTSVPCRGFLAR